MSLSKYLEVVLVAQLFFSFAFTGIMHALPEQDRINLTVFSVQSDSLNASDVSSKIQDSTNRQTNFAVVDIAILAIYSSNIFLDLVFNFVFAVPLMATTILSALFSFIPIDAFLQQQFKIFLLAVISVGYVILMIRFMTGSRTTNAVPFT